MKAIFQILGEGFMTCGLQSDGFAGADGVIGSPHDGQALILSETIAPHFGHLMIIRYLFKLSAIASNENVPSISAISILPSIRSMKNS